MPRMKTNEEFRNEVYSKVKDEYTVLGNYEGSVIHILMRHNTCGNEYKVTPSSFLTGCRCPKCAGNELKIQEEFVKEVFDLVGNEYTVLDQYINSKTKISMKHNKCGHEYKVTPHDFLQGRRCPKCADKELKTQEQFVKEVFDLVGDEYTVLGQYTGRNDKILMKHNTCGHEYEVTSKYFLSYGRCPKCDNKELKTHEQFVKEVFDLVGDEYTVLGNYEGSKIKILMKHNKCGHEYEVKPTSFLSGRRCPKCYGFKLKTQEEFVKEVFGLVGDDYTVLGQYVNATIPILMKHNKCGHEYNIAPTNFLSGKRCSNCRK